jgi:hypothetical protein
MGAPIETIRDDFQDNAIAAAWVATTAGSATIAETGGEFVATLPSSTAGTHDARYTSASSYDLTGGSFDVNITTMVATGVAAQAFCQIYDVSGQNRLIWIQLSGTLKAQTMIAGVTTDRYTVAWSAVTYKYLRIRESGGSIFFDSSTNGTSWTQRYTSANPFAVTDMYIANGAACGNIASPGSFHLAGVNIILPALSTTWRWTQIVWPLTERFRNITLALDTAGTAQAYVAFAASVDANQDPVSPTYWSGPADGGRELTSQATQATAQTMAVNIPVNGRFDLPTQVEGKVIRVYHRSIDGAAYTLREVYPRRLVQADDIEAESITALHIAANAITADKLDVTLTITGHNIQTAYAGARVLLSGDANGGFVGYGATDTYNTVLGTGTYQVLWSLVDGKFYFGAGVGVLEDAGISIGISSSILDLRAYKFTSGGSVYGGVYSYVSGGIHETSIRTNAITALDSQVNLLANASSAQNSTITLTASANTTLTLTLDGNAQKATLTGILLLQNDLQIVNSGGNPRVLLGDATTGGNFGYIQWNSTADEIRIGTSTGGDTLTITEAGIVTQAAWNAPSYANSWVDFGVGDEVGYYLDPFGIVHLRGIMKSGTINATAFTLPAGSRPAKRVIQAAASNGLYGTLTINTAGTVVPTTGSNVYFSLNGVSFPTQ